MAAKGHEGAEHEGHEGRGEGEYYIESGDNEWVERL